VWGAVGVIASESVVAAVTARRVLGLPPRFGRNAGGARGRPPFEPVASDGAARAAPRLGALVGGSLPTHPRAAAGGGPAPPRLTGAASAAGAARDPCATGCRGVGVFRSPPARVNVGSRRPPAGGAFAVASANTSGAPRRARPPAPLARRLDTMPMQAERDCSVPNWGHAFGMRRRWGGGARSDAGGTARTGRGSQNGITDEISHG